MLTKKFKLIYLSEDLTKKSELSLTRAKVAVFGALFVLSCLFVSLVISFSVSHVVNARKLSALTADKMELEWQLGELNGRLNQVEGNLAGLAQTDDFLRLLADLPAIDPDVRGVGVGGGVEDFSISSSSPEVQSTRWTLEKIEREIQLQVESFEEISSKFTADQDILDHTPSLRPVEGGYISSGFGYRRDPFTRRTTMHAGVDIPQKRGTPVISTAEGQVVYAGRYYNYGKLVMIDHGYDYQTVYGHLHAINVKVGERVHRGQQIGTVGATGRSTGTHLHYEVRVAGTSVDPLDYFFDELAVLPGQ
ncbi:M23 family metallopeptidase [bacterium]|nr:M23 family metallopeptidase [bacterium]